MAFYTREKDLARRRLTSNISVRKNVFVLPEGDVGGIGGGNGGGGGRESYSTLTLGVHVRQIFQLYYFVSS